MKCTKIKFKDCFIFPPRSKHTNAPLGTKCQTVFNKMRRKEFISGNLSTTLLTRSFLFCNFTGLDVKQLLMQIYITAERVNTFLYATNYTVAKSINDSQEIRDFLHSPSYTPVCHENSIELSPWEAASLSSIQQHCRIYSSHYEFPYYPDAYKITGRELA